MSITLILAYVIFIFIYRLWTHKKELEAEVQPSERRDSSGGKTSLLPIDIPTANPTAQEQSPVTQRTAIGVLLVATGITAGVAWFLLESVPITRTFLGLILLPILGNVTEHWTVFTMAKKDKMTDSLDIALGSAQFFSMNILNLIPLSSSSTTGSTWPNSGSFLRVLVMPYSPRCRIHAEQAAPSTSSTTIEFHPTQGQDLRTIFGNTSGSQANVAATVAFAPPTEHSPAPPASPMAASSDTSRSDSTLIDFNALGDLSDADFFACLDTINSMPMPAVPQTETDDTFRFFGDGFAYGLIPDASFDMQTDDFAGMTLSLPTLPLPPASPPTPAVTAAASTESTGDGNRKRKHKNEVDPENIVHTERAKQIPRRADECQFIYTSTSAANERDVPNLNAWCRICQVFFSPAVHFVRTTNVRCEFSCDIGVGLLVAGMVGVRATSGNFGHNILGDYARITQIRLWNVAVHMATDGRVRPVFTLRVKALSVLRLSKALS
ncbi:hypothetical protein B0H14DRAFT_3162425 [Mycena olivaceomarginata]|nr:hypothetical protein B0H14DRAFT_3162425 [Mycena olivaceomarginata]